MVSTGGFEGAWASGRRNGVIHSFVASPAVPSFTPGSAPFNPLSEKLERYGTLEPGAIAALSFLCRNRRKISAHETILQEGHCSRAVFLIVAGAAFRYKLLANGRRQILGYSLPGDLCDPEFLISDQCDYTVSLLTDAEVAVIPAAELAAIIVDFPTIGRALMKVAVVEGAMLREWLLNVGQRNALERIAHLICELAARLECIGDERNHVTLTIPLTQVELADSVGLTVVHVNRCLQRLRAENLIDWNRRRLTIQDPERLRSVAGFEDAYLKLKRRAPAPELRLTEPVGAMA